MRILQAAVIVHFHGLEIATVFYDKPHAAGGAWMVELGALSRPDLIPETIAEVLGLREDANRSARETVRDFLASREVLLVLDTCEHMVAECAALAEALLHESPGLRIIATSREALSVAGEVVYRVPSLSIPEPDQAAAAVLDAEAVRLFIDRATALDMTFRVDPTSTEAIARICRRLDGIPTDALTLAGPDGDSWVLMFAHMMQGHVRFKHGN